jgi:hypothetical protein
MKFELERLNQKIPDEELLADLRRVAVSLSQDYVTMRQQDSRGNYDSSTIRRRFGGWLKAHERSGLEKARGERNIRASKEALFRNIEEVWTRLGRQPRDREMFPLISKFSSTVYKRRFGSWMNGLRCFVESMKDEGKAFPEQGMPVDEPRSTLRHKTQRGVNWRMRFLVMRRDNFKCRNCGLSPTADSSINLQVDHIKAWANGGETTMENLQTLCSGCNIGKSDLDHGREG